VNKDGAVLLPEKPVQTTVHQVALHLPVELPVAGISLATLALLPQSAPFSAKKATYPSKCMDTSVTALITKTQGLSSSM
jgi:hypothetical protein